MIYSAEFIMLVGFRPPSAWFPGKVERAMENMSLNLSFGILEVAMSRWSHLSGPNSFLGPNFVEFGLSGIPNCICRI